MNLIEVLASNLRPEGGNVVVVEDRVLEVIPEIFRRLVPQRLVEVIDLDSTHPPDAHRSLAEAARRGAIVVMTASGQVPYKLAHVAWVWLKGDGLVDPSKGLTVSERKGGVLFLCTGIDGWLSIPREMQARIISVLSGGGHWFAQGMQGRQPLVAIEIQRQDGNGDPLVLLQSARSEDRRALLRRLFPPDGGPDGDGFDGHDEAILKLMARVDGTGDQVLAGDILAAFAAEADAFLSATGLKRGWPCSPTTEDALAELVVTRGYLSGQKAAFWSLVSELVQLGNDRVRQWLVGIVSSPSSDGFEPALYVARDVRLWPELTTALAAAAETVADPADLDLLRIALKRAAPASIPLNVLARLELDREDAAYLLDIARRHLAGQGKGPIPGLSKIAELHARLQTTNSTSYQRSVRTMLRTVDLLATFGSLKRAIDLSYLGSLPPDSMEHRATSALVAEILGVK